MTYIHFHAFIGASCTYNIETYEGNVYIWCCCACMKLMCCNSYWSHWQQSKVSTEKNIDLKKSELSHLNIKNLIKVQINDSCISNSIERRLLNSLGILMIKWYCGWSSSNFSRWIAWLRIRLFCFEFSACRAQQIKK